MSEKVILAVDQSTAGTKAVAFTKSAGIVGSSQISHRQIYPRAGWVEHDPAEIVENVESALCLALENADKNWGDVDSIAITNQRETVLVWDKKTGEPVCNAIVWQDGRAEKICEAVSMDFNHLREKTGLEPSPFFSAPKVAWVLENIDGIRDRANRGEFAFGTVDSFLLYKLTGGGAHKCDVTNASRTLLMELDTLKWNARCFEIFGIPLSMAPEIVMSDGLNEVTSAVGKIPAGIPIASMIGDSHGALFGQGCFDAGMAKATYGTGSSVMMNTGKTPARSKSGLVSSVAYGINNEVCYCLEGNINTTGGIIKWLCEGLGILEKPSESGKISASIDSNGGVYLVPALAGLAAPHWKSDARAAFVGMTSATTREMLVRAGEEAIAYQIADVVRAMEADMSAPLAVLRADGGPTRDKFLMDFQAGILGGSVETAGIEELSALGAAFIAGLKTGFFSSMDEVEGLRPKGMMYATGMDAEKATELYEGWKNALRTVLN